MYCPSAGRTEVQRVSVNSLWTHSWLTVCYFLCPVYSHGKQRMGNFHFIVWPVLFFCWGDSAQGDGSELSCSLCDSQALLWDADIAVIPSWFIHFLGEGLPLGSPGMGSAMSSAPSILHVLIFNGPSWSKKIWKGKKMHKDVAFWCCRKKPAPKASVLFLNSKEPGNICRVSYKKEKKKKTLPVIIKPSRCASSMEYSFCSCVGWAHGFLGGCPHYSWPSRDQQNHYATC